MGMFDNIVVLDEMLQCPHGHRVEGFQTKSFDHPSMATSRVAAGRSLPPVTMRPAAPPAASAADGASSRLAPAARSARACAWHAGYDSAFPREVASSSETLVRARFPMSKQLGSRLSKRRAGSRAIPILRARASSVVSSRPLRRPP